MRNFDEARTTLENQSVEHSDNKDIKRPLPGSLNSGDDQDESDDELQLEDFEDKVVCSPLICTTLNIINFPCNFCRFIQPKNITHAKISQECQQWRTNSAVKHA